MALSPARLAVKKKCDNERRDRLKAAGLCVTCSTASVHPGLVRCLSCKNKHARYQKNHTDRRGAAGVCYRCGKPGGVTNNAIYKNKSRGDLTTLVYCETCYVKRIAAKWTGDGNANYQAFLDIWIRQDGKCAYTGEQLKLGESASLDHIVPKSRGGTSTTTNAQWVSLRVNRMKTDLSHDDFVAVCRTIAERFK